MSSILIWAKKFEKYKVINVEAFQEKITVYIIDTVLANLDITDCMCAFCSIDSFCDVLAYCHSNIWSNPSFSKYYIISFIHIKTQFANCKPIVQFIQLLTNYVTKQF